jgi:hypothetical protein
MHSKNNFAAPFGTSLHILYGIFCPSFIYNKGKIVNLIKDGFLKICK